MGSTIPASNPARDPKARSVWPALVLVVLGVACFFSIRLFALDPENMPMMPLFMTYSFGPALCALLLLGWLSHVLVFWLGSVYGYLVGEATLRGGGRKRGLAMQVIAGAAAAIGSLVWAGFGRVPLMLLLHVGTLARVGLGPYLLSHFLDPFTLIGLGLGIFFAVMHVRYI